MDEDEVETREVFLPTCLTAAKLLRVFEVREVLVICQDSERMGSAFEIVMPFLEGADDGEKLTVINIVVAFGIVERMRHKGDRVPVTICILLAKDCAGREFRGVGFELKWLVVIGDDKDGGSGKRVFKLVESFLMGGGPDPRNIFTCKGIQGSDDI